MKKTIYSLRFVLASAAIALATLLPNETIAQQKEKRSIDSFESISLSIHADVHLRQADNTSLEIEGPESLLQEVETVVEGSTLKIRFKDRWFRWKDSHKKLIVFLSSPEIKNLKISGSGTIKAETPIKTDYADYSISGSGNIIIDDLMARNIECSISGSGDISLKGEVDDELKISISGSGDIDAAKLKSKIVSVQVSGSGDCRVYATEDLKARVAGSGDIYYYGKPNVDAKTAGSGKIKSISKWD